MDDRVEPARAPVRRERVATGLLFLVVLGAYGLGARRALAPGDPAEFVLASATLGVPHPTGYPLYTWLGRLATAVPLGTIPARVHFLSAVFAALAVVLLFRLVLRELERRGAGRLALPAALVAALGLAAFPPFWRMALVAEVYTLKCLVALLLVTLVIEFLERGRDALLLAAALVAGLGLGAHTSLAYLVVCVTPFVLPQLLRRPRLLLGCLGGFTLGLGQYAYLWLRVRSGPAYVHEQARFFEVLPWTGTDSSLHNLLWFVSGGRWQVARVRGLADVLDKVRELAGILWSELDGALLALALAGLLLWATSAGRRRCGVLAAALAAEALYFVTYRPSETAMVLPLFALLYAFAGLTLGGLPRLVAARVPGPRAAPVLAGATLAALAALLIVPIVRRPFLDLSGRDADARCVERLLAEVPPGSVVDGIGWGYDRMLLYHAIVEHRPAPFRLAFESDAERARAVVAGRAFVLGERTRAYRAAGYRLLPFLEEPGAPTLFRIAPP